MSCVNSAVRYVEFKRMGNLKKKTFIKGTDLEAGMVIRDSICQRLAISCDHMHSGGLIQLPLKSVIVCCCLVWQLDPASLRQAWPLYCIMFLLLASNRDIHMEGTRMFPCSFIVNVFSFCRKSKWMQKHCRLQIVNIPCLGLGTREVMVLRRNAEIKAANLWASPAIWKLSSFLCCSNSRSHHCSPSPEPPPVWDLHLLVALSSQVFLPWKGVTVQSQCRVKCCSKAVQGTPPHLFSLLAILGFLWLVLPTLGTQKPVCLACLVLFLHLWSYPPGRAYILKNGGCLKSENYWRPRQINYLSQFTGWTSKTRLFQIA